MAKKVIELRLAPGGRATIHASNVTIEVYGVFTVDKPENEPHKIQEFDVDEDGNLHEQKALS